MTLLVVGLIIFLGIHLLPERVSTRAALIAKLGANGYKIAFSVISLVGLVLIVMGKSRAGFEPLYNPPAWGRYATALLMIPAVFLFPAANLPTNLHRVMRHPMLLGTLAWAVGHLLANGDKASVILFGSFAVFSVWIMRSANRRGAKLSTKRVPASRDVILIVVGVVAYAGLYLLHPRLFGVPVGI